MSSKIPKQRADELLVLRGGAESRAKAQALILAGKVRTGPDAVVDKPGRMYSADTEFVVEAPPKYVSRGGLKLEGALAAFAIDPSGLECLDVGASTGGFSDCLLQAGASAVTCVDVGCAQLHQKLRDDPRVTNFEKVNGRDLAGAPLPRAAYALVVADLSFISLTKVLPAMWSRVAEGGRLVTLVKPQFECARGEADKGRGVIRDPAIHMRVVAEIRAFAERELPGCIVLGVADSPITGGDGNREFLIAMRRG